MARSAHDCRRPSGAQRFPWRHSHLLSGCPPALLYRLLSSGCLLRGKSRRLGFLKEHPLVCGLFYGAAVDQVMTLIVLPLSALHARGPYKLPDLLLGLIVHSIVIGLPISFSVRRFAK